MKIYIALLALCAIIGKLLEHVTQLSDLLLYLLIYCTFESYTGLLIICLVQANSVTMGPLMKRRYLIIILLT